MYARHAIWAEELEKRQAHVTLNQVALNQEYRHFTKVISLYDYSHFR